MLRQLAVTKIRKEWARFGPAGYFTVPVHQDPDWQDTLVMLTTRDWDVLISEYGPKFREWAILMHARQMSVSDLVAFVRDHVTDHNAAAARVLNDAHAAYDAQVEIIAKQRREIAALREKADAYDRIVAAFGPVMQAQNS